MIDRLTINPEEVASILIKFIADEVKAAGYKKVVLGLSGGLDSTTTAYLSREALGKKNVFGIIMPCQAASSGEIKDAEKVGKILGIDYDIVFINPILEPFMKVFEKINHIRKGNIIARLRMIILYDQSKTFEALVLGSSNKSELMLGYGTIYGDMACALNPLGGLYKTQVWQLAQYLGVPRDIILKTPSADLWPGQTDEGELGLRYKEVDPLLYCMVELGYDENKLIEAGFKKETISKVKDKVRSSEFKRRMPLIAEIKQS
jgi:NAD+ synthase